MSEPGMKKGETRFGPRSLISTAVSAIEVSPPMPDALVTDLRKSAPVFVVPPLVLFGLCVAVVILQVAD